MDAPASPPAPNNPPLNERLAVLQRQIRDLRQDLKDTLELIDKLRENCLAIEAKLAATEQAYALLLEQAAEDAST